MSRTGSHGLTGDSLSTNRATPGGGGLAVIDGTATLSATTISSNFAAAGGGINVALGGTVSLTGGSVVTMNHPDNCAGTTACLV